MNEKWLLVLGVLRRLEPCKGWALEHVSWTTSRGFITGFAILSRDE